MKIISSQSQADTAPQRITELLAPLKEESSRPSLVMAWANIDCLDEVLAEALMDVSDNVMLASSCRGAMTQAGVCSGAGLLAFYDEQGAYGIGHCALGSNPEHSGYQALQAAIDASGQSWQSPDVIWCSMPPGQEEAVIEGMRQLVGDATPIIGGSTGDNDVTGDWIQLSDKKLVNDHIVVVAMYPSQGVGISFSSGYTPTELSAEVTKAEGREVIELNGRPAVDVYKSWVPGLLESADDEKSLLYITTYNSIGRVVANTDGIDQYVLSHLSSITQRGGFTTLSKITEGERIFLMSGSPDSLVIRGAKVMDTAQQLLPPDVKPAGAIMVYCAGCMMALGDDIHHVPTEINNIFNSPYLGAFTFGEQGCFSDRSNRHGNLMISSVVFGGENGNT